MDKIYQQIRSFKATESLIKESKAGFVYSTAISFTMDNSNPK